MSHSLEIREDGTAAFLAVREPGWHKLGIVMDDDVTMEQALLIAGMRYEFELQPVYTEVNGQHIQVSGERQAVVRRNIDNAEDIKAFGGGLSTRFVPHSLLDMWAWVEDLLGHGATVETIGNLKDGAHSFAVVKLPATALADTHDATQMYLTVSTGHDGTRATQASVSPVRVVCANTLYFSDEAAKGSKAKVRHNMRLDSTNVEQAAAVLGLMREQADMVDATYSTLKAITLRDIDVRAILDQLFVMPQELITKPYVNMTAGEKRKFSIVKNSRKGVTETMNYSPFRAQGSDGWSLWQAAIEWADYVMPVKGEDQDARRAERAITGVSADIKTRAFELITA